MKIYHKINWIKNKQTQQNQIKNSQSGKTKIIK